MPLQIVRNDITKMDVDAIICPAELKSECEQEIVEAKNLPCKYVISVKGPQWNKKNHRKKEKLISCCRRALQLGAEYQCQSMAIPLISTGTFGCPKDLALRILADTICEFLISHEMMVYLVVYDSEAYGISRKLFRDVAEYIDEHYVAEYGANPRISEAISKKTGIRFLNGQDICIKEIRYDTQTLEDALSQIDESFSEMLLRKIDESDMTDAQCYKKANIDRRLFAKIRADRLYKPSKRTVLAFAIALELSLDETKDMLMKAGFALSHSSKSDIIVEYFITHKNYNIFEINEVLFAFDQSLLGG